MSASTGSAAHSTARGFFTHLFPVENSFQNVLEDACGLFLHSVL
jgi:hypothetical protein